MRCRTAQQTSIAATDRPPAPRVRRALERHLARCEACRADAAGTNRLLEALAGLSFEREVPARVEQSVLRRVRILAGEEAERAPRLFGTGAWPRRLVPAFVAAGTVGLAVMLGPGGDRVEPPAADVVAVAVAKAPVARDAPRVAAAEANAPAPTPADPPPVLVEQAELFVDLRILTNLDKLENFDSIATTKLDDGTGPPSTAGASSG